MGGAGRRDTGLQQSLDLSFKAPVLCYFTVYYLFFKKTKQLSYHSIHFLFIVSLDRKPEICILWVNLQSNKTHGDRDQFYCLDLCYLPALIPFCNVFLMMDCFNPSSKSIPFLRVWRLKITLLSRDTFTELSSIKVKRKTRCFVRDSQNLQGKVIQKEGHEQIVLQQLNPSPGSSAAGKESITLTIPVVVPSSYSLI